MLSSLRLFSLSVNSGMGAAISVFRNEELLNSISKINAQEAMKYDLNAVIKLYQEVYFAEGAENERVYKK